MTSSNAGSRSSRAEAIRDLAALQAGVIRRGQLRSAGWSRHHVQHEIDIGRWTRVAPEVIALQNAPLDWAQRLWLGVLHAGPGSALSHRTACQLGGLTGWEDDRIEVLMTKSHTIEPLPGFIFHETRRAFAEWVHGVRQPPMLQLETAALLAAERQPLIRAGIGLIAACVQQRLTTAHRLFTASTSISKLRHGHHFRLALWDIDGGSHSFAELDVRRRCVEAGIQPPRRQSVRLDSRRRRRYLDLEWDLPDGTVLVLEIDGAFHLKTENWWKDMRRERRVVASGATVLRCSTIEVRLEFWEIARDLMDIGVPRLTSLAA